LEQIFSVVTLPTVDYPSRPRQYHAPPPPVDTPKRGSVASFQSVSSQKSSRASTLTGRDAPVASELKRRDSHLSSVDREQEDALAHLDNILQHQFSSSGSLVDTEEPMEPPEVHSGSGTLKSSRASTLTGHNNEAAYNNHQEYFQTTAQIHLTEDGTNGLHSREPAEFNSVTYETHLIHNETHVVHDEEYDSFEPARLGGPPVFDQNKVFRNRSMTVDSQVSIAESRFGGFDLVDEHGGEKDEEINLHHNEVAYVRPKKVKHQGSPHPQAQKLSNESDEQELKEYQQKLHQANLKQSLLKNEIKKMEAVVLGKESVVRTKEAELRKLTNTTSVDEHHVEKPRDIQTVRRYSYQSDSSEVHPRRSVSIYEEEVPESHVEQAQLAKAHLVGHDGPLKYYQPQMRKAEGFETVDSIEKIIIGGEQEPTEDDKVVLLFGPIGSGKTTLIMSIMNFLYDVKKEHDFRFVLEDPRQVKPTKSLTAYVFHNTIFPFSVTFVDAPGVPNKKGYNKTSTIIREWFEKELKALGHFRLDAISIVMRHDEGELGWPFVNELAVVKKLFGDDLKENVMPLITCGEVLPQPVAIRSLVMANITFMEYFKVNNSGFWPLRSGENSLKHSLYHKKATAELERYFHEIHDLVQPLLAVLRNRNGHGSP